MTAFEEILGRIASALEEADIGYMVIGGQAVLIHGDPRQTQDIDVTLAVSCDEISRVMPALKTAGLKSLAEKPQDFARKTNVLPMSDVASGRRVDVIFSDFPYERQAVARAVSVPIGGRKVRFASAEDLLIHKLAAGRPIDLQDARGIWLRKGKTLDRKYIERWIKEFAGIPGLENISRTWRDLRRPNRFL